MDEEACQSRDLEASCQEDQRVEDPEGQEQAYLHSSHLSHKNSLVALLDMEEIELKQRYTSGNCDSSFIPLTDSHSMTFYPSPHTYC